MNMKRSVWKYLLLLAVSIGLCYSGNFDKSAWGAWRFFGGFLLFFCTLGISILRLVQHLRTPPQPQKTD